MVTFTSILIRIILFPSLLFAFVCWELIGANALVCDRIENCRLLKCNASSSWVSMDIEKWQTIAITVLRVLYRLNRTAAMPIQEGMTDEWCSYRIHGHWFEMLHRFDIYIYGRVCSELYCVCFVKNWHTNIHIETLLCVELLKHLNSVISIVSFPFERIESICVKHTIHKCFRMDRWFAIYRCHWYAVDFWRRTQHYLCEDHVTQREGRELQEGNNGIEIVNQMKSY